MNSYPRSQNQIKPPLQATKWLKIPVLIDSIEMESLIDALGPFHIYLVSGPVQKGKGEIKHSDFLHCYSRYVDSLKKGEIPTIDSLIRSYFSSAWSLTSDVLYSIDVEGDRELLKVDKPVIQLQMHKFGYSASEDKFRTMVFGLDSLFWGIQFSYPQLYQDEKMQIMKVAEGEDFLNTTLFKKMQKWIRENTQATPFIVNGKKTNVPIRLGKACFSWINNHPQLHLKGLVVNKA